MRLHLLHLLVTSLTAASARRFEGAGCENSQMQDILRANSEQSCSPRRVIVEVRGDWNNSLLAPSHLEVSRCVGSCGHYHHSCLPLETITRRVPSLLASASLTEGVTETLCGALEVKEHTRCGCGCQLTEESCATNQQFLPFECRCVCSNHHHRDDCLARGWHWDRKTCACTCPNLPYPTCPNSLMFDYLQTCSCIPTHSRATVNTVSFFLSLAGFSLISVFTVMKYYLVKKAELRRTNTILHLNPSEGDQSSEPHSRELVDLLEDRGGTNQDLLLPTNQSSKIYD